MSKKEFSHSDEANVIGLLEEIIAKYGSSGKAMFTEMIELVARTLLLFAIAARCRLFFGADEVKALRLEIERLKSVNAILRKRLRAKPKRHHTWLEKLHILWHMEVFGIPRQHVQEVFGIARSTYYRWLRQVQEGTLAGEKPMNPSPGNKTNDVLACLVWHIFDATPPTSAGKRYQRSSKD